MNDLAAGHYEVTSESSFTYSLKSQKIPMTHFGFGGGYPS